MSGRSLPRQLFDQLRLYLSAGILPPWYYLFDLHEARRRAEAGLYINRFETKRGIFPLLKRGRVRTLLRDKAKFAEHCRAHGVRCAQTLLEARGGKLHWGEGVEPVLPARDLFLKVTFGRGGTGAERFLYRNGYYRSSRGKAYTPESLLKWLQRRARWHRFIVQPCLATHPALADLTAGALATVRVVTCLDEQERPEIVAAVFRMPVERGSIVDNFHAGGIASDVDIGSGTIGRASDMGRRSSQGSLEYHPTSGALILGHTLPHWEALKGLAVAAHQAFHDHVIVGWDIALLADGPCVIEGNVGPDLDIVQRARRRPIGNGRFGRLCAHHVARALRRSGQAGGRPRVALLIHDFRASGVVRNALAVATRLSQDFELTLVGRHGDGLLADEACGGPWRTHVLSPPRPRLGLLASAMRLRAEVVETKPELLLSFGNRTHWLAWLAMLGHRRPARIYRLSNAVERPGRIATLIRRVGLRMLARDAATLAVVGGATTRSPAMQPLLASGKAIPIPAGVDIRHGRRLAAEGPPPLDRRDNRPVILAIGRIGPQKDFATLIRAAAVVNRTRPIRLVIVGKEEGRTLDALRQAAVQAGLPDHAFLLPGETPNVFPWLAQASVFVLASRWEGSSLALLEAMALEIPVIAARQAGDAAEVLGDGRCGLLFDAGNVGGLAGAILRQLSERRVMPGRRARAYDAASMTEAYAALVHRAIGTVNVPDAAPAAGVKAVA